MIEKIVLGGGVATMLIGFALDWFGVAPVLSTWLMFSPPIAFVLFLLFCKATERKPSRRKK